MRGACVRLSSWRLTGFPLLWREAVIHSAARPLVCTAAGASGSNPAPSASSRLHHEVNQPPYLSTWRSPPTLTRPSSPPQPRVRNFRLLSLASRWSHGIKIRQRHLFFFTGISNKNRSIAIPPRLI